MPLARAVSGFTQSRDFLSSFTTGACCGTPNEILRLLGATNIFVDIPGGWTPDVVWLLVPGGELVTGAPEDVILSGGIATAFEGRQIRFHPAAVAGRVSLAAHLRRLAGDDERESRS